MHDVLEDIYLEYACAYIFYYNMILNLKSAGQLNDGKMESIKTQIEQYTRSRDEMVCSKHGINSAFLEDWIKKSPEDGKVVQVQKDIANLH